MSRPKARPFKRRDGSYWARVRYTDESGKTRDRVERAASAAEAHARSIELLKEYDNASDAPPRPLTFNKFADLFTPHIEGLRSYKTALGFLQTLRDHFGHKRLNAITYQDIEGYYKRRLKSVSLRTGRRLKRASVNREVALLSRMFNEAVEQGFAAKNPYKDGPPLVKPEQENKRNRILSDEEKERLLAVCTGRRAHLRPVIIAALDMGATKSQLLQLKWEDVRISRREIAFRLPGRGTVTVRMGEELADALLKLYLALEEEYFKTPSLQRGENARYIDEWMEPKLVFRDFKTSFSSACRAAKVKDFRFSDLRNTVKVHNEERIKRFKELLAKPHNRKPRT